MRSSVRDVNSLSNDDRIREMESVLDFPLVGPIGSYEYDIPCNLRTMYLA